MSRQYVTSPFAESAQEPVADQPRRMSSVTPHLVLGSAAATTLLLASSAIIVTAQEGALREWWTSSALETPGTLNLLVALESFTVLTNLAAFVVTGLWLLDLRRVAEAVSPSTQQRRSGYWAFLGWIVPVVFLWFPYQVVADASRGVGSKVKTLWPWWIAWLALVLFNYLSTAGGELVTEADLTGWIRAQQVLGVLAVVAFVLWWRVVRSASAAAMAAIDRVRVTS